MRIMYPGHSGEMSVSTNSLILFSILVSYCRDYVNVTDDSRFWNTKNRTVSQIELTCQDQQFPVWTRFLYSNTTNAMIPHNCTPSQAALPNPPCGSLYRGWILGEHPSLEDGKQIVVYFSVPALVFQILVF